MLASVQNQQAQSDLYGCTRAWSTLNNHHNEYSTGLGGVEVEFRIGSS